MGSPAPRQPRLSSARGRCSVDGAQGKLEHESSLLTCKGDGLENVGFNQGDDPENEGFDREV